MNSIASKIRAFIVRALPTSLVDWLRVHVVRPLSIKSMVSRQPKIVRWIREDVLHMKPVLYHFEIHITDHCNLNCKGCAHFSNLCPPTFADLAEYEADMRGMAENFSAVRQIYLLGGEPLLHPEVAKFVRLSREIFPKTRIYLMTNGLLVTRMNGEFWRALAESRVVLLCDSYPINLPVDEIEKLGRRYGVKIEWTMPREEFFKIPIDVKGGQSPSASFQACKGYNNCPIVRDGKLYPCAYAAFADVFVDRFGIESGLEVGDADFFSVRQSAERGAAMDFLSKPIPWCANCDFSNMEFYRWGRSKRSLDEWTSECADQPAESSEYQAM